MAKARFTQDQLDQAKAWFFENNTVVPVHVPGAGNNGSIIVYKNASEQKEENGNDETASE
jgi:hypothetical protein